MSIGSPTHTTSQKPPVTPGSGLTVEQKANQRRIAEMLDFRTPVPNSPSPIREKPSTGVTSKLVSDAMVNIRTLQFEVATLRDALDRKTDESSTLKLDLDKLNLRVTSLVEQISIGELEITRIKKQSEEKCAKIDLEHSEVLDVMRAEHKKQLDLFTGTATEHEILLQQQLNSEKTLSLKKETAISQAQAQALVLGERLQEKRSELLAFQRDHKIKSRELSSAKDEISRLKQHIASISAASSVVALADKFNALDIQTTSHTLANSSKASFGGSGLETEKKIAGIDEAPLIETAAPSIENLRTLIENREITTKQQANAYLGRFEGLEYADAISEFKKEALYTQLKRK